MGTDNALSVACNWAPTVNPASDVQQEFIHLYIHASKKQTHKLPRSELIKFMILDTRVGTLIVATIYLQLIQNRYITYLTMYIFNSLQYFKYFTTR